MIFLELKDGNTPLASKTKKEISSAKEVSLYFPASLAPKMKPDDNRQPIWTKQRKEIGFDNTELWNLDITFARLMLPRIKKYLEYAQFERNAAWKKDITLIIKALELMAPGDSCLFNEKQEKTIRIGLSAFARRIRGMWY